MMRLSKFMVVLLLAVVVYGNEVHVNEGNESGTYDGISKLTGYRTIQEAVNAAQNGDTVVVWPGVYDGFVFSHSTQVGNPKAITVRSADLPAIIESPGNTGVVFGDSEGTAAVLENFVIRNCFSGVEVLNLSTPTLKNLTIVECDGAITVSDSSMPVVVNCIVWDNYNCGYCDGPQLNGELLLATNSWSDSQLNQSIPGIVGYWNFNYIDDAPYGAGDDSGSRDTSISADEYYAFFNEGELVSGQAGQGISLDGTNDYLWVKDQPKFSLESITAMLWLKAKQQSFSDGDMIIGQWSSSLSNSMFRMNLRDTNGFSFAVSDGISEYAIVSDSNAVDPNTWVHLAGMYDNNTGQMQLYINGELHKEQNQTIALNNSSENVLIGKDPNNFLEATVDEIAIFDRLITKKEISRLYFDTYSGYNYGYPWFADTEGGDYRLKSSYGRFAGQSDPNDPETINWVYDSVNSPGLDWGDPNQVVGAETLPNGTRINAGAYGGTKYASKSLWDTNKDRIIDMDELLQLAENWLMGSSQADLNQDGLTDMIDYSLISKQWLEVLPYNYANGTISSPTMAMAMSEPEMAGLAMQNSMSVAVEVEQSYSNEQYEAELFALVILLEEWLEQEAAGLSDEDIEVIRGFQQEILQELQ